MILNQERQLKNMITNEDLMSYDQAENKLKEIVANTVWDGYHFVILESLKTIY